MVKRGDGGGGGCYLRFEAKKPMADAISDAVAMHSAQKKGLSNKRVLVMKIAVGPSAPPIMPTLPAGLGSGKSAPKTKGATSTRTRARLTKNAILNTFFIVGPPVYLMGRAPFLF